MLASSDGAEPAGDDADDAGGGVEDITRSSSVGEQRVIAVTLRLFNAEQQIVQR
ncbi:hypothetical protein ACFPRL_04110 [Pseudoclavibacter helvolus]